MQLSIDYPVGPQRRPVDPVRDHARKLSREWRVRQRNPEIAERHNRFKRYRREDRLARQRWAGRAPMGPAPLSREQIKRRGGELYAALLLRERDARAKFRARHPDKLRAYRRKHPKVKNHKAKLCAAARARGRKRGFEATIKPQELVWPTHCPVLGIELDYPTGKYRGTNMTRANWPSLDRLDNSKGYVKGNVFVISFRANTIKAAASQKELAAVLKYMRQPPLL